MYTFVSKYFKYHKQLCVSGSHGKNTKTSMLKCLIEDCNYIIGDGSGITHSLSHASASGVHVARNIVEQFEM